MRRALVRGRDERGATALLVAIVAVVLFGAAALAVDYSALAMERQQLHDNIDAAAHAGAFELPDNGADAVAQATAFAKSQDSVLTPDVATFCVVASRGTPPTVNTDQVPTTCDPGTIAGQKCNSRICVIPCSPAEGDRCNAVRVSETKSVPYGFAKVIGFSDGSTGTVTSLACKGSCGSETPNPLDVVIMADRTRSMTDANRNAMSLAIENMLLTMDPTMHYVALGAINKSVPVSGCPTQAGPYPFGGSQEAGMKNGTWVPTDFSRTYASGDAGARVASPTDPVVMGLRCLRGTSTDPAKGASSAYYGTHLAAAMKGAARKLLVPSENNLASMPARPGGPARKVIIFETDGRPFELFTSNSSTLDLGSAADIGAGTQASGWSAGQNGCKNLVEVAKRAKEQDITIITIGFGDATSANCSDSSSSGLYTRDALAAAASPSADGSPTVASKCNTPPSRAAENADGDNYFCAVSGSEMADIFKVALAQVSNSIRFLQMPS